MQYEDEEIWKPVVGYEGLYEVSTHGRVKSVARIYQSIKEGFNWDKRTISALKATRLKKDGYVDTGLSLDGKYTQRVIHRLVAEAFIPNPENKPCVNHIDNNRSNNHVSNLEWVNHKENTAHSYAQNRGTWQKQWGEDNVSSKLNLDEVLKLRKLKSQGKTNREVSDILNINIKEVGRIHRKERWNFPEAFPEYYEPS